MSNPMKEIKVEKVVLNIGVGKGGKDLSNAEKILEEVAGQRPVRTHAKQTSQTFGFREGAPVGCKVTLRGDSAVQTLDKLLTVRGNELNESSFDEHGNFSFGIDEHIEIQGMDYDPEVGIFGMDVSVNLVRDGSRVKKRRRQSSSVASSHRVDKEEAIEFVKDKFDVRVV
ncbi:50S ribosomal protein L5 [candidate division MSBL1 archaeon SCGC-AAA259O05]|uniref:Large ribosomal subunit protein uL5 n=1 Tax=candidate division MSBL1 archaeon SCGC-AAA259O05 TaxID=1698271 RepID=A0A133V3N4_9EURY|nr:50S ribosomal protein L5 [candidate division MSBL1 archaeon SCGC-AAA259O05]